MRGKAYLDLEDEDSGVAFSYFLAERLHRTVAELDSMDNAEYVRWNIYYARKAQIEELAAQRGR